MSKLEDLKNMISGLFTEATDKKTIDAIAQMNSAVEAAQKEQDALTARNAELLKSYKDLVQHTAIGGEEDSKGSPAQSDIDEPDYLDLGAAISEDALRKFLESEANK